MNNEGLIRTIKTRNGIFDVDTVRDKKIAARLESGEYHQEETLTLLKNFITPDSIVVDIGAHIGTLAIPLAKIAGKVIAFEPTPATFALLKKNIEQNILTIDARNKGLAASGGHASLKTENSTNAGANTLAVGRGPIEVSTLDDEVEYADLIKIDVEGMELEVLKGAAELIEKGHPVIFSEINLSALRAHSSSPRQIEEFLYKRGYGLYLPLADAEMNPVLGSIGSLGLITACIAPRSWLFRSRSSTFDILAIPRGKPVPLPIISYGGTLRRLIRENLAQKGKRIAKFLTSGKQPSILGITRAVTFRASSIGDSLMGKYLLENIHMQFPAARLGIVVSSRAEMIKDLFPNYPWLEIIEANRRDPRALLRLWSDWRGSDVIVTQYAGKTGSRFATASKLVARLLAKKLIGFTDAFRFNALLYDQLLPFLPDIAPAEHERKALRAAGLAVPLPYPTLTLSADPAVPGRFNLVPGRYVIAHLFSGSTKRGLSTEKRQKLIAELKKQMPGIEIVLSGGKSDRKDAEDTAQGSRVIAGEADLREMQQLVFQAACTVSLDTGIAHIAGHLRRPLIVISTCMGLFWWGSRQYGPGIPSRLFSKPEYCKEGHVMVDYPPCMNEVDMKEVARAVASLCH